MESDKVADIVGVVSAQQQGSAPLWFDITGEEFYDKDLVDKYRNRTYWSYIKLM